jgi:alpha-glucosidase (family GH31 glycosyl hydrolase)
MTAIISGKRRFSCLTPRLVRIEFSPTGVFEERRSLVAYNRPQPSPFESMEEQDGKLTLRIGGMTIFSQQNERDFFPSNLRIDFKLGDRTQTWRFGDRDYRNLGGAVRSLDYYERDSLLDGVHPASTASPDDYFHVDAELFDTAQVYMQDGHFDWQMEIMRQGLHGSLRYAPHMVYNRFINMAGDLTRFQPGLLSRNGYFLLNDSTGAVLGESPLFGGEDGSPIERDTPGTRDLYFFAYGTDYKAALADYRLLGGVIPLPAKNVFGILFSRWPAFSDAEARTIVERFEQEGIPLSALMLDLEWHVPDFSHWDWNPETYPQPESFLEWAHSRNLLVALNVHPQNIFSTDSHFEPFVKASEAEKKVQSIWENPIVAMTVKSGADRMVGLDLANQSEAHALTDLCCNPILRQGVDFWWLDGASAQLNGADGQLLSTKFFYETTETGDRRGMTQARYGGLGSHRYGVLFTGDTQSQWEVLQSECEFNIRAGQVGMAYVSHDIGGFSHSEAPIIDSDLYIRWLQFGVFNPVLRFHSAPGSGSRQPWDYGTKNLEIAGRWLKLRHSLMPYIYTAARQAYETGLPLVRGLYLDHPDAEACYRFDEYLFGDSLLVAPLLTPSNHRTVTLPDGMWYEFETGKLLTGGGDINVFAALDQVPVYVKAGAILPRQTETVPPAQAFVSDLLLDVYPGSDGGDAVLYEDDSRTRAYQQDGFSRTRFSTRERDGAVIIAGTSTEGKCFGDARRIQVRVIMAASPAKVTYNGVELPAEKISFDSTSQRLTVDLGTLLVDQGWEVVITK